MKNKKGDMADLGDYIFTVVIAIAFLFFVGFFLNSSVEKPNQESQKNLADFKRLDSAVTNIKLQVSNSGSNGYGFEEITLNEAKLNEAIARSKVLGGRTITLCEDYFDKESCNNDIVGIRLSPEYKCSWDEEKKSCAMVYVPTLSAEINQKVN